MPKNLSHGRHGAQARPWSQKQSTSQLFRGPRDGCVSGWGSRGRPRTRSPRMLRWISSVPPAIDCAGTDTRISATMPASTESGPVSMASAPAIAEWARRSCGRSRSTAAWRSIPRGRADGRRRARLGRAARSSARVRVTSSTRAGVLPQQRVVGRAAPRQLRHDELGSAGALRIPLVGLPVFRSLVGRFACGAARARQHAQGSTDRCRERSFVRERRERDGPARAGFADDVGAGDASVGQEHLVERRVAVHLAQRPHFHARLVHRQGEAGNALVLRYRPVGPREQQAPFARAARRSSTPSGRSPPTRRRRARRASTGSRGPNRCPVR